MVAEQPLQIVEHNHKMWRAHGDAHALGEEFGVSVSHITGY
jgi:hypothetical protein